MTNALVQLILWSSEFSQRRALGRASPRQLPASGSKVLTLCVWSWNVVRYPPSPSFRGKDLRQNRLNGFGGVGFWGYALEGWDGGQNRIEWRPFSRPQFKNRYVYSLVNIFLWFAKKRTRSRLRGVGVSIWFTPSPVSIGRDYPQGILAPITSGFFPQCFLSKYSRTVMQV